MNISVPQLTTIEYVVIIVYLIFLAAVGPLMKSFTSDSSDYFNGGARTKWWLLGPSLAVSVTSAAVFTGVAGAIFEAGLAPMASNIGQYVAGIILVLFLAAWFRQLRKVTPAEVMRERFGPATEQFFAYVGMFMQPVYGAFQLLGLAIFVAAVFQLSMTAVIIGLGVVVGFYSVSGGKWAVMATDFVQSLVLMLVMVAIGILAVVKMGGVSSFVERVSNSGGFAMSHADGAYPDGRYTMGWLIAVFCMQFISQLQLGWSARFFSAKDGKEAQKATALMLVMLMVSTLCFLCVPLAAKVLYSDQVMAYASVLKKPEEAAYVVACLNLLPAGVMGLVLVAMFSASASSMDTGLNANAAIIVRNILPPLRRKLHMPMLDSQSELAVGKTVSIILCLVIVGITLTLAHFGKAGIFEIMLSFAACVNFPMTLPFFLVLFLKRAPRNSALSSIIAGLILPWLIQPLFLHYGFSMNFSERLILTTSCSLLGFFGSYLFRSKESPEDRRAIEAFYAQMHRPVDFEKEVGQGSDLKQLKLLGNLSCMMGAVILLLLFVPNTWLDRITVLSIGCCILGIGLWMLWGARRGKTS